MRIAAAAAAVIATGCYSPALEDCAYRCTEGACPSGLTCRNGLCRTGSNAGACVSSDASTGDATSSAYAAIVRRDHPIAYWRLGDMVLATKVREEIAQRDGTVTGVDLGVPGALFGDPDTAGLFQATESDCIEVMDNNVFDLVSGETFTLEAWVKLESTMHMTDRIVVGTRGITYGYELGVASNGVAQIRTCDGVACTEVLAANVLAADVWFHLAATYNGPQDHEGRVFVNGMREPPGSLAARPPATTPGPLTIGCRIGSDYYGGWLDEVAVYDYVLEGSTIEEHFRTGIP